jgi:hypothetical protein
MDTYIVSFEIRTDLDPAVVLDLLHVAVEDFIGEVESHGGEVEDYNQPKETAAVETA